MKFFSRNNPRIKQARQLNQRKQRDQTGLFLVEGIRHVGEAFQSGAAIDYLIYAPDRLNSDFAIQLIQEMSIKGLPCLPVTNEVFEGIAEKENPQGILAIVRQKQAGLNRLDPITAPWVVALVSPQDPGNIGTILRTMDAVGASALLLLEHSADIYHSACVRASMGALFWYPIVRTTFSEFEVWARRNGYHVYGTSANGVIDYLDILEYKRPLVLLLGSERQGLAADQSAICEQMIRLPMEGRVTSLNLSIAAGVMLYAMYGKLV